MDMEKSLSDKTEYIFADYFRLICAIGIVALHLDPFYDINEYANIFVGSVLTRLCVPFFFLLSGFFLKDKLSDWSRLKKYVSHLIKLYIVYTILYLPVIYHESRDNGKPFAEDAVGFIRKFFFVGSYGQLWYFLALIFAVVFLYVLITRIRLGQNAMMAITISLFLIGLFFRVYDKPIRDEVDEIGIVALYDSVFSTTRNGLFFGFPFVYWGNLIWKKNLKIERNRCGLLFGLSLGLLTLEAVFVRNVIGARQLDMLFLLPVTSVTFVIYVLSKKKGSSKQYIAIWCRKMSVLIFGFHLLINFCIDGLFERIGYSVNSFLQFMIVLMINTILAMIVIFVSEKKYGYWIEKVFL